MDDIFSSGIEKPLNYAIVVLGGSAGSLVPLQSIVADLPEDLPAALFVTTHVPPDSVSAMPHILSRSGSFFATHGIDGAPIGPGRIIVAPPNYHLLLQRGIMRVVDGARENGQRPSIDVLFRSAASVYGRMVTGVLLSGTLDDGVSGLEHIQRSGGCTIVQDPVDALFGDMPRNAINARVVDVQAATEDLAAAIVACTESAIRYGQMPGVPEAAEDERDEGKPSMFTCPDCGGVLFELEVNGTLRFRCHTGHAYNVNSIMGAQKDSLEASLWAAMRVLEERVKLLERMAARAGERGDNLSCERFLRQVEDMRKQLRTIRLTLSDVVAQRPPSAS